MKFMANPIYTEKAAMAELEFSKCSFYTSHLSLWDRIKEQTISDWILKKKSKHMLITRDTPYNKERE